jgi:hypothetical protein
MNGNFANPTSSFGYYRGVPLAGGQGSGMGPTMAGVGVFSAGSGTSAGTGSGWNPTILYMFGLIILEMVIFGFLAKHV